MGRKPYWLDTKQKSPASALLSRPGGPYEDTKGKKGDLAFKMESGIPDRGAVGHTRANAIIGGLLRN